MTIEGVKTLPPLYGAQQNLSTSFNELSSGKKSFATTSPAMLMIGQRMLNNAQSTSVANLNVNFASSRSQTVDSYLQGSQDTMSRLKELSVQANNGILSDADRESINTEAQELLKGLDQNYQSANFNGQKILQGGTVDVAVNSAGDSIQLNSADISRETLGIENIDLSTSEGAAAALESLDGAIDLLSEQRAKVGSDLRVLDDRFASNLDYEANLRESGSKLTDLDYAFGASEHAAGSIQSQIALAMTAQANNLQGATIAGLF
ncbi:hypothetical protein BVX99_00270 [bacterium F16]|nr:hypothetical protein BVX99_00270 [bacterium F16]